MKQLIDKSAIVAEIERRISNHNKKLRHASNEDFVSSWASDEENQKLALVALIPFIDTLEVKEVVECKQPEYSYFKTTYQCGKKPRWNIGDTLAYYEFYTDREGEHVLGKVTKVDFDKEQCDWFYTLEGGSVYDEQSLLEDETYKKN